MYAQTDVLATFLEDAHHNACATIANLRPQYNLSTAIDALYCKMIGNLNQHPEYVTGFFLIRAHSSFRAGIRLALSGQLAEAYMVLRGCLESSLYGLYVAGDESRQEVWLRRHDDETSRRRVGSVFSIKNVQEHLQSVDSKTHGIVVQLYDRTIDLSGHPNERAITAQIDLNTTGCRTEFTAQQFLCGDISHLACLKAAGQVGICCLDIFSHVFRDRYRIFGIDLQLDRIRQRF